MITNKVQTIEVNILPKAVKRNEKSSRRRAPALTPEDREDQLIALAIDLAEKQLSEGTASAQVITHYLKLGSTKERLEKEKLENENVLLKAKTESIKSHERIEGLYQNAINAFRTYSGGLPELDNDDY